MILPTWEARPSCDAILTGFDSDNVREITLGPPSIPGYAIEQELGRGGMGVVYRAQHEQLKRPVALKVILGGEFASPEQRLRFLFEAELAARIRHPSVVQVFEAGTHQGHPFLVSELVEGGTLAARLQDRRDPLSFRAIAELLVHLAHGVQAAHAAGVIHRDLKPANVLLAVSGDAQRSGPAPKIADFGLAKAFSEKDSRLTATGMVLGTPNYMAPEQARGEKDLGPAIDVYALGAILYECLCRQPPFHGFSTFDTLNQVINDEPTAPRKLRGSVPRDLEIICLKALRKSPAERYGSAAELAADLVRWLEDRPIAARPTSRWERGYRWCRRNRALAASLVALTAVVVVSFALLTWLYLHAESQRERAAVALTRTRNVLDDVTGADEGLGAFAQKGQMTAGQRRLLEKAASYYADFAKEYRDDPEQLAAVAGSLFRLGTLQSDLEQTNQARQTFMDAIALYRELDQRGELEPIMLRELGAALHNLSVQYGSARDFASAVPLLKEAIQHQQRAVKLLPDDLAAWDYLGNHWQILGLSVRDLGDVGEANRCLTECVRVRREAVARFQSKPVTLQRLARSLTMLADLHIVNRTGSDALGQLEEAERMIAQLRASGGHQPPLLSTSVELGCMKARILMAKSDVPGALAAWHAVLPDCEQLCTMLPGIATFRDQHALVLTQLADALAALGRRADAVNRYQAAIRLRQKLRQDFPENQQNRVSLAGNCCNMALPLCHLGRSADGLAALDQGEAELLAVLQAQPNQDLARLYLWNTRGMRAQVLEASGQFAQATAIWETLYPQAPPHERPHLHLRLAVDHARLGHESKAREWLKLMLKDRDPATGQILKAGVLSRLAEQQREAVQQEELAGEAVAALRTGLRLGYRPASELNLMPDLRPLASHATFRDLLWQAAELKD